jgi:hypothetical protein
MVVAGEELLQLLTLRVLPVLPEIWQHIASSCLVLSLCAAIHILPAAGFVLHPYRILLPFLSA